MKSASNCISSRGWVAAASGMLLFLCGCDPTVRATVEDGIIAVSQSLLGAFLRAILELAGEAQQSTAAAATDTVARILM